MTPTEAKQIVGMIAARYPTPALPLETLKLWARLVVDLDYATAERAAMGWFRANEERLDPARLRRLVAAVQAQAVATPYLDPDEAWAHVEWAVTRVGGYQPFPDTHPLVAETVRAIGWPRLCQSDNSVADRAHFLQLYRGRLERARCQDAATPGATPHAAMGQRPSLAHPPRPALEPAKPGEVGRLVGDLSARLQAPRQLAVVKRESAPDPEPEITDAAELARRDARRRELRAQGTRGGAA